MIKLYKGGKGSGHHGHSGRPGMVGGSTPKISNTLSDKDKLLKDYLEQFAKFHGSTVEGMVLEHGKVYKPETLPSQYRYGRAKECYSNAWKLVERNPELTYVEGIAFPDFIDLPIEHAWAIDKQGNVVDNTWNPVGSAYIGIPFNRDFVIKILAETGTYGVLDHEKRRKYFQNGMPENAIKKEYTIIRLKGGPGSGHHGHAGRPGKVGGGLPDIATAGPDRLLMSLMGNAKNWRITESDYRKGVSDSYKVNVFGDGQAIVKEGTNEYSDYDKNDPYKERDTYLLAKELGFDNIVPVGSSAYIEDTGKHASVQQWVSGDVLMLHSISISKTEEIMQKYGHELKDTKVDIESFQQVAWLDAIIGNTDRHGGNLLVVYDKDTKTWSAKAIDHNLALMKFPYAYRRIYNPIDVVREKLGYVLSATGKMVSTSTKDIMTFKKSDFEKCMNFVKSDTGLSKDFQMRYGEEFMDEAAERLIKFASAIETGHPKGALK